MNPSSPQLSLSHFDGLGGNAGAVLLFTCEYCFVVTTTTTATTATAATTTTTTTTNNTVQVMGYC